ncbi:MAG: hypothetical protein P1Q69_14965 [Candidatus Thorarchaeota archaeon]|nr:hypothetical protein [Candidatus Thorarchaeota archaeon]
MVEVKELFEILKGEDKGRVLKKLSDWGGDAGRAPPPVSDGEREALLSKARTLLEEGFSNASSGLIHCIGVCTPRLDVLPLVHSSIPRLDSSAEFKWVMDTMHYGEEYIAHVYRQWGIFKEDEHIILSDIAAIHFGNPNLFRVGTIFLTDQRLLVVGALNGPFLKNESSYRPLYDDWKSHPLLHMHDFVYLRNISAANSEWNRTSKFIRVRSYTRYAKEKGRTLYGPYFFKFDLPTTVKEEEGPLELLIELQDLPSSMFPKDWRKTRQDIITEKIQEQLGNISAGSSLES